MLAVKTNTDQSDEVNRYSVHLKVDYVEYLLLEDTAVYMNFFGWGCGNRPKKKLLVKVPNIQPMYSVYIDAEVKTMK